MERVVDPSKVVLIIVNRLSRRWRITLVLAMAAVAVVLVAVAATALAAGRDPRAEEAPEVASIEAVAEKLAAEQARERAELNVSLASAAEVAHGHMGEVLQKLSFAVSAQQDATPNVAGADGAGEWELELELERAMSALDAVGEGTSEQTVAREAFVGAAYLLESAVADYGHLLNAPHEERESYAETVIERRDAAVRLWQSGAAQLDTLTVESGGGHVHLFLAPDGDPDAVPLEFQEPDDH